MVGPFSPPAGPGASPLVPPLQQGPPGVVNTVIAQQIIQQLQAIADNLKAAFSAQASGDLSGIFPGPIQVIATHLAAPLALLQGGTGNTTGQPSGAAGGDLSGAYPNPAVEALDGHSITPAGWVPVDGSGATLVFAGVSANYTRIGNLVFAYAQFQYPVTASGANAKVGGLPFIAANHPYGNAPFVVTNSSGAFGTNGTVLQNTNTFVLNDVTTGAAKTNANLSNTAIQFVAIYPVV